MKKSKLTKSQRQNMLNEVSSLILTCTPRPKIVDIIVEKYGYSIKTTGDIICEAQKAAAKSFTDEEVVIAKQQIKHLSEEIMNDSDEFAIARLRGAELLGKLMKLFDPDVKVQNTINTLNLSGLSLDELKALLNTNNEG